MQKIIMVIIIILVLVAAVYGVYSFFFVKSGVGVGLIQTQQPAKSVAPTQQPQQVESTQPGKVLY